MDTIDITYALNVVDRGISRLLRDDRAIRKSVAQTAKEMARQAREAVQGGARTTAASRRSATAVRTSGVAARAAAADTRRLVNEARQYGVTATRSTVAANRQADAYRRVGREATIAARAQRTAGRAGMAGATAAGAAGSRMGGLAAGAGAGIGAGAIVSAFVGFEKQMDRVQATAGATTAQMRAMTGQAKQLGADTAFSAKEAADGMYQLSTAGFTANQTMKIIPGTLALASASGVDLAQAAELQAAAIRGFGLSAKDAGRVADVLAKTVNSSAVEMSDLGDTLPYVASTARQTGTSFEQVAAAAGILGNAGIKGSMAGTALRTSMLRLTDPTKKMRGVLDEMGISAKDLAAQPLPEVIGRVAEGLKKLPTRGEKVGAISAIFGKEAAPSMLNLMSKGREEIDKLVDGLKNSEGAAKRTADIMRGNVAGAWDEFTGSIETASITLVERFGPAMRNALKGAAGGVNQIAAGLTGKTKVQAGLAFREGADGKRTVGEATGTERVVAKIRDTVGTIGRAAASAGKQLLAAFKPAEPFFRNILLPLLGGIAKSVLSAVVTAFKVVVPIVKAFATVLGAIGNAARPLKPVFAAIGSVIGFVFAGPILKGIGLIGKLGSGFRILGAPIRAAGAILRGIGGIMSGIGRAVWSVIKRITGLSGSFTQAARAVVTGLIRGLVGLGGRVLGFFTRGFGSVFKFLGGIGSRLFNVGKSIVTKLIEGIKSAPGAIVGAIRSLVPGPLRRFLPGGDDAKGNRRGGIIKRFQEGGLVPSMVSPGELVVHRGASWTVPGPRTAADSVFAALPVGAAVVTGHGQQLMAGGASLSEAIAAQLPHFMAGGRVADVARAAGFKSRSLITSLAVSKGESGWDENAKNQNSDGSIDRGLWQINSVHGKLSTFDPAANARAAWKISSGGKNWKPWVVYKKGLHKRHLAAARAAAGQSGGKSGASRAALEALIERNMDRLDKLRDQAARIVGDGATARRRPIQAQIRKLVSANRKLRGQIRDLPKGSGETRVPIILGPGRRRAGLLADAFSQGRAAGQAGLTRGVIKREGNPILRAIAEAQGETTRVIPGRPAGDRSSRSAGGASGGSSSFRPGGGWAGTEAIVRTAIRGLGPATFKRPANHRLSIKNPGSDHNMAIKNAFAADLPPGDGVFNTLRKRLGIPARKGAWNKFAHKPIKGFRTQLLWHAPDGSHRDHNHLGVRRLRRGGIIGRYAPGGIVRPGGGRAVVGRIQEDQPGWNWRTMGNRRRGPAGPGSALTAGLNRVMTNAGGSLEALDTIIGRAMEQRLAALRDTITKRVRKGGPAAVVRRLQGVLDLIDHELGRRVGRFEDVVEQRTAGLDRGRGTVDRAMRARGIAADSVQGLGVMQAQQAAETRVRAQNVSSLQAALRTATRARNREAIRDITGKLHDAQGELQESMVRQIELWRDTVRQAGQEAVSTAGFGVSLAQGAAGGLDVAQRLARTNDTPEGMRQRAGFIEGGIIPRLQEQVAAAQFNAALLASIGDIAGWRQAVLDAQSATTELASAQADAADLMREAAARVVQDMVDTAVHGTTMADLRMQRLEVEQRLTGTFDSAGSAQARADFIRQQIVPALDAEIMALSAQQMEAERQGNADLVRQLKEQIFAKQTDILQKNLDANETTADNTDLLKEFAGSTAFSYRDMPFRDNDVDVIAARLGA